MAGTSIRRPDVEVQQEFVTTSPTVVQPTLLTCIVAPCLQIVDAFDDDGNAQDDAYAGTYKDGYGVVAYDLPNLNSESSLDSFEDEVRVFLLLNDVSTELRSENDETEVTSGTGDYDHGTLTFTDATKDFSGLGVEIGDVVRLTYLGHVYDLPITEVAPGGDVTKVEVESVIGGDVSAVTYTIVRDPAQFYLSNGSEAWFQLGDETDYIEFTCKSTGDHAGSLGDNLSFEFVESDVYASGTDGANGDGIFTSVGKTFTTTIGPVGAVTDFLLCVGTLGLGADHYGVHTVVNNTELFIETGIGVSQSGLTYYVGEVQMGGLANGEVKTGGTIFEYLTGGFSALGAGTFYLILHGANHGVFLVTVLSDTQLTIVTAGAVDAAGYTWHLIEEADTDTNGATPAGTRFDSLSVTFTADMVNKYINRAETAAKRISAYVDPHQVTLASAFTPPGSQTSFKVVDAAVSKLLTITDDVITFRLARVLGLTQDITYADVEDAITNDGNPTYNEDVAAEITAALGGAGATTITATDLPIVTQFDGGSDDDQLVLDANLIGSTTPTAKVYVSYKALRLDVTDQAAEATLWTFNNTTEVEESIGPITPDNPLALACYFALANCPSRPIKALGVSEVSAAKPFGTPAAYLSAFEFLEGFEVYFITPITQDPTVHQYLKTHVDAMSGSTEKHERVGLFSQEMPTYAAAEVIASGTTGNTDGTFEGNPAAEFSADADFTLAGATAGDILVVTALADSSHSPDAVNGTVGPLYGGIITEVKSGDDYVLVLDASTGFVDWDSLVDVSWTLYRAGSAISQPSDQAEAIAAIGESFADRRMRHIWPDIVIADVDGTTHELPGSYHAAGWAGKGSQKEPQNGYTNDTVTGFIGLKHSNGYFSNADLDRMAGGGTFIAIQESENGPLKCRHQLTTDTSSIQKREESITEILDYVAKYCRQTLSKNIGTYNITQSFLDALAAQIAGIRQSLLSSSRLKDFKLVSMEVPDDAPDTIEVTIAVEPLYPSNYIIITLEI